MTQTAQRDALFKVGTIRCETAPRRPLGVFGIPFCGISSVLLAFLLILGGVVPKIVATAAENPAQPTSSSSLNADLPDDAGFKFKWSDSRDIGVEGEMPNAADEHADPIGFRLAIPEFWQANVLEEEDGYSIFFGGDDTTGTEDPAVKLLLGVYMGVKQDYSDLDAMTETYRDTSIASQTLLYAFEDSLNGHAYRYFQVRYPHQQSGKMVDEFAFFIETKRLIYRFSFVTPESQSERNELFVWSIFNSLILYDNKLN
ncbi:MAG: hypothetical protein ABJL55_17865 [Roseibium sp.]